MISEVINKILNNESPTKTELVESFDEVFSGIADEITSASFISLLSKFLSANDDIDANIACIKSANSALTNINTQLNSSFTIQMSEFNIEEKFLNVIFARDIIIASCGVPVIRYFSLKPDSLFMSLLDKFYIKPCKKEAGIYNFEDFEKTNYSCILLDENENYFKYSTSISKKLCFENILNLTEKFLNPCRTKNIVIGLDNPDNVEKFAKLCLEAGYQNSLVISSYDNTPFISPEKESYIAEAWKNKIFAYKLSCELVGLKTHLLSELECQNIDEIVNYINDLFLNKTKSALYDTVVVNSALALYITKKADSIMDGINMAKNAIDSRLAYEKLESLKNL